MCRGIASLQRLIREASQFFCRRRVARSLRHGREIRALSLDLRFDEFARARVLHALGHALQPSSARRFGFPDFAAVGWGSDIVRRGSPAIGRATGRARGGTYGELEVGDGTV